MAIKLINIGFENMVFANRLVAIVSPESAHSRSYDEKYANRRYLWKKS